MGYQFLFCVGGSFCTTAVVPFEPMFTAGGVGEPRGNFAER